MRLTPWASHFPSLRANAGKSTARIAIAVVKVIVAR
jgi:hypothetical protein